MKENLQEFIGNNRDDFDTEKLPSGLWDKIENDLPINKKKMKLFNLFSLQQLAAAVTVTAVGLAIFLVIENKKLEHTISQSKTSTEQSAKQELQELNPDYAKEIDQFTRIIQIKQTELEILKKDNPALYNEFIGNIKALDEQYTGLQKQLSSTPEKEQLIEAMLQNLRLQTELLNEQLTISKQIKQSKNKRNEKATQAI
jgi:hypothetical protein